MVKLSDWCDQDLSLFLFSYKPLSVFYFPQEISLEWLKSYHFRKTESKAVWPLLGYEIKFFTDNIDTNTGQQCTKAY